MIQQCWADPDPMYLPAYRHIIDVIQGYPTVVRTSFEHGYTSGIVVRIKIPFDCKMEQLHGFIGPIIVIDEETFSLDIDSTSFTPYVIPVNPDPIWADICSYVIPIGELGDQQTETTRNVL